ncbi:GntR family transcriptional regulator [Erwinia sp. S43]|uniref:GntR family transcriptional regulator n=1 Tax=Pantoea coffeiphila TaxID=1465635 RepID=A0A2S9ICF4_9GAMM|nr:MULTISPECIES: GntR family transcriptional regulator [Erwiniaceae]MBK0034812.1 GntR family transcriptional regulator [Erwinia sp. S43]MCW1874446.1 GntR family transcriptional regulator [Erwinia sp. INIA01]PRD15468.1 GntR family transcriptional regulator [Pantoea coffeiphila]
MTDYQDHTLAAIMASKPLYMKSASLSEQVYVLLKELILERKIPGNSEMSESRLADELQVSRTPMREALVRLAGENLLERRGARSYTVRSVDIKEYLDTMALRELLEVEAVGKALDKIGTPTLDALIAELHELMKADEEHLFWRYDEKLHNTIAEASGNVVLAGVLKGLRVNVRLFRLHSPLHRQSENHTEHLDLLTAMREGDREKSLASIRNHISKLRNDVMASL